ncbi:50S ribosomal protein L18 [Patescibacteria group bacterium]|nr:50S ribosomal protein L18 [Patescibacteria group bacterium]
MKDVIKLKKKKAVLRARRVRSKIHGTKERPRLSVFRSLKHISAQLIDDDSGVTLAQSSDRDESLKGKKGIEKASFVGTDIAKKALGVNIKEVVFDRGSSIYKGRVKALAEASREAGLEF